MKITALCPLPLRDDWMPGYLSERGDKNRDFAWDFKDAQGMYPRPPGKHGAVDWFAPGDTPLVAPFDGKIVRTDQSPKSSGQVYGGVLAIEHSDGYAMQFRHVHPEAKLGSVVKAGDRIGRVTGWMDSPSSSHAHTEVLKSWPNHYLFSETINPREVNWVEDLKNLPGSEPIADFYFEEMPHDQGGTGPVVVWHGKGSPLKAVAVNKARGRIISTVKDADGVTHVLWWKQGTYPNVPIFGPWVEEKARNIKSDTRATNTGRTMRRFRGRHRSLYPLAAGS